MLRVKKLDLRLKDSNDVAKSESSDESFFRIEDAVDPILLFGWFSFVFPCFDVILLVVDKDALFDIVDADEFFLVPIVEFLDLLLVEEDEDDEVDTGANMVDGFMV